MKRVFIVDDDETYSRFLKKSIEKEKKYLAETFINAEDCLIELELKINPQILIIDYFLPGMNGLEFYHKIKKSYKSIKLIMLSSNTDGELVVRLIKDGIRNYVIKDENVIESLLAIIEDKDDEFIDLYEG